MKRYYHYIFIALLAIIFGIVYSHAFDKKLDLNGDNANYLLLAENIAKGNGYAMVMPDGVIPASHYPPGYSFFLSIFMFLGINNLIFFKILNGLLFLGSLYILFYLVRKITNNNALAFVIALLPMFAPSLLHFSSMVMSEMLFLFCTVFCLLGLFKYSQKKKETPFWKSPWFYVAFLSATISYYIRTVGMATIFAVVVFYLFRKEWKQCIVSFAGIVLTIIPWSIRNSIHGIESRYFGTIMTVNPWRPESGTISTVSEFIEKMIKNFDETVIKGFKEILFPFINLDYNTGSGFIAVIAGFIILAVILYGAWNLKPLRWALMACLLAHIGLFMLWHGGNGARYVVPIAPLLFVCFYVGIYKILTTWIFKKESIFTKNLPYAFIIMAFFMIPSVNARAKIAKTPYHPAYQNYFSIAKELEKQAPNTICCCRKPELFRYFAPDIFTINYLYSTNPNEVIQDLINKKINFVVLEQLGYSSTGLYLYPAIQQNPELFPIVWHLQNPDTYLLRFEKEKAIEKLNSIQE